MGQLARLESPSFLVKAVQKWFVQTYRLNMEEAEKPLEDYKSLDALFTRRLKPGSRPLGSDFFLHPADSQIREVGKIENFTLIQAKKFHYSLSEFIGNHERSAHYEGGCYLVYYLCPTDYHRVHSPVEGVIKDIKRLGLDLWPVHDQSVQEIPQLFLRNERVVVSISTQLGPLELVMVGATNVGSIEILKSKGDFVQKGEDLGVFHMGSTVVMVYSKSMKIPIEKIPLAPVQVGQNLFSGI